MFEWKDALPLLGVVVGWGLSKFTTDAQWKRARDERLNALKLETYAEWAAGKEANFIAYAMQQNGPTSPGNVPLCEKRLLLLEPDPETRRLIQEVNVSIPNLMSREWHELDELVHSDPEWEWKPFREAMDRLLDRVRSRLNTK